MGIGPGDEVIVPSFTWVATANAVIYCGATPVLVDVETTTFNINIEAVKQKISARTKAIIPVHLFGLCADMDALQSAIPENILILEDAACAAGAIYKGKPAGSLGDMAAFSFHPRKSITTGEGGMVTTNNDKFADLAEIMRNHGAEIPEEVRHLGNKPYLLPDFKMLGYNYRMTDLQAAIGIVQLKKLKHFISEREKWAHFYRTHLADLPWIRPQSVPENGQHAWQAFVCYIDPKLAPAPRNTIMERLQSDGISTRPGTHAIHLLSYYAEKYNLHSDEFPNARDCDRQSMAIPLHNKMTPDDFEYIVEKLHEI
jgi:dTDP-4-amino-4,6-dideoxygalactose transaminase